MRRKLCLLLILGACNMPGPHFEGLPASRVRVAGMTFDVRVRGELAEAMRINPQWAPRLDGVAGPAAMAMARVSGCRVTEVRGDQALLLGLLDCGDGTPDRWIGSGVSDLYCYEVDAWRNRGLGQKTRVLDCDPAW